MKLAVPFAVLIATTAGYALAQTPPAAPPSAAEKIEQAKNNLGQDWQLLNAANKHLLDSINGLMTAVNDLQAENGRLKAELAKNGAPTAAKDPVPKK